MDIRIRTGEIEINAALNNSVTASRILKILPIKNKKCSAIPFKTLVKKIRVCYNTKGIFYLIRIKSNCIQLR